MFKKYIAAILLLSFDMICMNAGVGLTREEVKEKFNQNYIKFEKHVLAEKSKVWWGKKTRTIEIGAKTIYGYDDDIINLCIYPSYPFWDRPDKETKEFIKKLHSDESLQIITNIVNQCSEHPTDFKAIAYATYHEGKRLEAEKLKTGQTVSQEEHDTFVIAGVFIKYWFEKELFKQ